MIPIRKAVPPAFTLEADPCDDMYHSVSGFAAGGPVGAMHAELNARLNAAEYERWLLPPQQRDGMERVVHALSLASGAVAMASGMALLWFIA